MKVFIECELIYWVVLIKFKYLKFKIFFFFKYSCKHPLRIIFFFLKWIEFCAIWMRMKILRIDLVFAFKCANVYANILCWDCFYFVWVQVNSKNVLLKWNYENLFNHFWFVFYFWPFLLFSLNISVAQLVRIPFLIAIC